MTDVLPNLFSPLAIRGHRFKNRIFSTGHMTVMLENGLPSDAMVAYHKARAEGGAGLIIIEAARAHVSGISSRPAIHAFDDACIDGYRRIATNCHANDCRIFGQLTHPGREMAQAADGTLAIAYAPSAIPNERFHVMPREMPQAVIKEIVAGFGTAAGRLKTAGLDGVEIVASHGYLAAQFLNPRVNIRTDRYGGSFDNRLTFLRETLAAVRKGAGSEMIVGIRLSGDDLEHDGLVADEVLEIAAALEAAGLLDYINVTAGSSAGLAGSVHIVPPMAFETAYTAPFAAAIKTRVSIPVFVAGRVNQPQIAEQVLKNGQADMCGMTRALISDPDMPLKAHAGQLDHIRACVACNQACIGHMLDGLPISCIQRPETGRELEFASITPATTRRHIMVVGGGPGGMKAAIVAAKRGHQVVLYEATSRLGGQVNLAQMLPGRAEFGGITSNLLHELKMTDVTVELNTQATRGLVERNNPDTVILATGATPYQSSFPGSDQANVVDAWQVLKGERTIGGSVVIADWRCDWIGMGIAEMLVRNGSHVRLAVNGMTAGQTIPQYVRDKWLGDLHRLGVEIIPYTRLIGVDETDVYLQHTTSGEPITIEHIDTLVTALGHQSCNDLSISLSGWPGSIHQIGDCLAPRTVEEAILDGLRIGVAI